MTTPPGAEMDPALGDDGREAPPRAPAATRPWAWSVRRELWENRSLYGVPLAAAAVALFGFTVSAPFRLPGRVRSLAALDPEQQRAVLASPYGLAASVVLFCSFLVAFFYCLDALYGERRDRSILFWKSLPVSDLTTVLAKASVPLLAVPALAYAVALTTQLLMLLVSTLVLAGSGAGAGALWRHLPLPTMCVVMAYGLAAHVLWFAPLYAWLLLVSAWARRLPFLWAVLPPLGLVALERLTTGTSAFNRLLHYRLGGAMQEAFTADVHKKSIVIDRLAQLDPLRFLGSAGLWLGLLFAAGCLAAAVRLRRRREPI